MERACHACAAAPFALYAPAHRQSPARIERLRQFTREVQAQRAIHTPGQELDFAFTLARGWACRFVLLADGRRQILSFLLPGDTVGFGALWTKNYTPNYGIATLTSVSLCGFPHAPLRALINECPDQRRHFARYITGLCREAEERLTDVGQRSAESRIASLVLDLHGRLSARGLVHKHTFPLPLRQQDFADALGLTIAHINRTLRRLRQAKLLEIDAGLARAPDLDALKRCAGGKGSA